MSYEDKDERVMASETTSSSSGSPDGDMSRLASEIRGLAHDHIELAALETRLAVSAVLRMAIIAIVTALVLVSAWLALVGSAALGLIGIGLSPALAMLCVAAVNLLLALIGWLRIKRLSHWLGWPATQRAIKAAPAAGGNRGAV